MRKKRKRRKLLIPLIMIIVALPMAFVCAMGGGSLLAYVFATILAIGVDRLFS